MRALQRVLLLVLLAHASRAERIWLPGSTGSGPNHVAKAWTAAFVAKYPEVDITFSSIGSGATQKALYGDIDCVNRPVEAVCTRDSVVTETLWGLGDAPLDASIYDEFSSFQFQQFPACASAVAIMHSKEIKESDLKLSFEVLSGIFNETIQYWDDPSIQLLNDDHLLPHERIAVVVREDSSGQTSILTDAMDHYVPAWPDDAVGKTPHWPLKEISSPSGLGVCQAQSANASLGFSGDGKNGVALGMLRIPYSIGYMEMEFSHRFEDFLSQVQIQSTIDHDSFVEASPDSLLASMEGMSDLLDQETLELNLARSDAPVGGFPISGYAYWYLKLNETSYDSCYQAWLMCKFVEWSYLDPQAKQLSAENGWVVPPMPVALKALERLKQVRCVDRESDPPKVISALRYVPPPYREKKTFNTLWVIFPVFTILIVIVFAWGRIEMMKADNIWKVRLEDLIYGDPAEVIGQGSFGQVLLAEYRGTQVAVKRIVSNPSKSNLTSLQGSATLSSSYQNGTKGSNYRRKLNFIREMRILAKLRHPCVTTVLGAVWSDKHPMLVMEYMEHGSLYDILHNDTLVLDGDLLIPMLRDISQGVRFLHSAVPQVIHSDLKAKNILVDRKFRAKVADFGLSSSTKRFEGKCGSPFWMAPELISGTCSNTASSDMYAFGIMLYEVFSRKDPYEGEINVQAVLEKVADPEVQLRPPIPKGMPVQIEEIMKDCLQDNPIRRPSAEVVDSLLQSLDVAFVAPEAFGKTVRPKDSNVSLFDIFPRHVAEALRDGRKVEPEHKECVTIFFSDIVGFTDLAAKLAPAKVANLLDRLYHIFDDLSEKHDVFKVETIGDAYMAVTNLIKDQGCDHAKRIAMFAVEATEAAQNVKIDPEDESLGFLSIRAGFHSGPVVADVVGNRNPRYCLFGDTVNTASRMESNSEANRIHCSEQSYTLLCNQYPELKIAQRGRIYVKGKGGMVTYWVNEVNDPATKQETDLTVHEFQNVRNSNAVPKSPIKRVMKMVRGTRPSQKTTTSTMPDNRRVLRRSRSDELPSVDLMGRSDSKSSISAYSLDRNDFVMPGSPPPTKSPMKMLTEKIKASFGALKSAGVPRDADFEASPRKGSGTKPDWVEE